MGVVKKAKPVVLRTRKAAPVMILARVNRLSPFDKIQIIKSGVSKAVLEKLKEQTGLDYDALTAILSVSRAFLIGKKGDAKFDIPVSEKIVALADIYSYGYEVFEDEDRFNRWMATPNRALGGKTPIALLDTLYGMEEIKHLIGRIDYGVYS